MARNKATTTSERTVRTDGELTRLRILEAAGQLYSAQGYAQTPSKLVAGEAGVDLASINYHFGSRGGLYKAVLIEAHQRMVSLDELHRIDAQDAPPADKLRAVFEMLVQSSRKPRGWHARLFAREVLAPTSNLREVFGEALQPKIAIVVRIISQVSGLAADDPALLRCLISTMAPCLMLLVASHQMPGPAGKVAAMPAAQLVAHLHAYALGGLAAIQPTQAARARTPPARKRRAAAAA